jgi:hypothetical protein
MATSLGLLFGGGEEEDALAKLLRAQSPGLAAQSERQAALQAAAALLQAGGPSRAPVSLGQALGGALQAGQQGYQAAQQQGLQRLMLNQQLQQMQQQQQREQALRQALTTQPTEAQRFQAGAAAMGAEGMGPTVTAARAQEKAVESARPFASLTPEQRLIASQMPYAEAVKYIGESVKPEEFGTSTNTGMIGGRPVSYVVGKRGGIRVLDVAPKPEEEQIKTGNTILIRDKNTGKTIDSYNVEMSPYETAQNLRSLRAEDLAERKFAFDRQTTQANLGYRAQEIGLRGQEVDLSRQRLAQGDVELVTDGAGNMSFVSKTGAPTRQVLTEGGKPMVGKVQPIPTVVTEEFVKNQANINSIDTAMRLVQENPGATGPITGRLPSSIRDPLADQRNVETRGAVARIGSMLIKDISGATVPVAEVPRLAPFIPLATDDDKTIQTKLNGLKREIISIEEERKKQYTAQGMKYPSLEYRGGPLAIPGTPSIMQQYGLTPR